MTQRIFPWLSALYDGRRVYDARRARADDQRVGLLVSDMPLAMRVIAVVVNGERFDVTDWKFLAADDRQGWALRYVGGRTVHGPSQWPVPGCPVCAASTAERASPYARTGLHTEVLTGDVRIVFKDEA